MRRGAHNFCAVAGVAAALLALPSAAAVRSAFAYELADLNGSLPMQWPRLSWDGPHGELYVVNGGTGTVDIFNDAGMVVYTFGGDAEIGSVTGVVPAGDEAGDLFVLAWRVGGWRIVKCNFRGEPIAELQLSLPKDLGAFEPGVIRAAAGKLFLADLGAMKLLVLEHDGSVVDFYDVNKTLKVNNRRHTGADMRGFNVDASGTMYGTIPSAFVAFTVTPDGQFHPFGERGSTPGHFNIASGIAADDAGNIYISDTLRCVVMVFDKERNFLGEFGYRGDDDDLGLIAPSEIAVGNGRVYVTQSRGGVKAFDVLVQ